MILRIYRAMVRPGRESEYLALLNEQVLPEAAAAAGLVAFHIGRRMEGAASPEFVIVTLWDSLPALQTFTGSDWTSPIFFDGEEELVERLELEHFEALAPGLPPAADTR